MTSEFIFCVLGLLCGLGIGWGVTILSQWKKIELAKQAIIALVEERTKCREKAVKEFTDVLFNNFAQVKPSGMDKPEIVLFLTEAQLYDFAKGFTEVKPHGDTMQT